MSNYLADAHREWHYVHGKYNSACPLDCGAMSPEQAEAEEAYAWISWMDEEAGDARRIRCAHCRDRHATVEVVRACADLSALVAA